MSSKYKDKKQYMSEYPQLSKWINECVVCHHQGYDPNIDIKQEKLMVKNIKSLFPPLEINADGMCPVCEKLFGKK